MPASASERDSVSLLNCGACRDPGKERTSTRRSIPDSRRSATNSPIGCVEWPMVKTLGRNGVSSDIGCPATQETLSLRQRRLDEPRPIGRAERQDIVVEVVAGMVEILAVLAVADPHVAARPRLQHEGEILGAHAGQDIASDIALADDLLEHAGGKLGLRRGVDGRRVAAEIAKIDFGAIGGSDALGDA